LQRRARICANHSRSAAVSFIGARRLQGHACWAGPAFPGSV